MSLPSSFRGNEHSSHRNAPFRRSALLGGEQRPGNSAGEGSTEFTPGELPIDRENAGEPLWV